MIIVTECDFPRGGINESGWPKLVEQHNTDTWKALSISEDGGLDANAFFGVGDYDLTFEHWIETHGALLVVCGGLPYVISAGPCVSTLTSLYGGYQNCIVDESRVVLFNFMELLIISAGMEFRYVNNLVMDDLRVIQLTDTRLILDGILVQPPDIERFEIEIDSVPKCIPRRSCFNGEKWVEQG